MTRQNPERGPENNTEAEQNFNMLSERLAETEASLDLLLKEIDYVSINYGRDTTMERVTFINIVKNLLNTKQPQQTSLISRRGLLSGLGVIAFVPVSITSLIIRGLKDKSEVESLGDSIRRKEPGIIFSSALDGLGGAIVGGLVGKLAEIYYEAKNLKQQGKMLETLVGVFLKSKEYAEFIKKYGESPVQLFSMAVEIIGLDNELKLLSQKIKRNYSSRYN